MLFWAAAGAAAHSFLSESLTPVGASATMYVVSEDLNQIVVCSSRDVRFHYLVQGIRVGHRGDIPV